MTKNCLTINNYFFFTQQRSLEVNLSILIILTRSGLSKILTIPMETVIRCVFLFSNPRIFKMNKFGPSAV